MCDVRRVSKSDLPAGRSLTEEKQNMGIFNDLMNKIFHYAATAERPADAAVPSRPTTPGTAAATATAPQVDVASILTKLSSESKEELDWTNSIVDLMKLVGMDS